MTLEKEMIRLFDADGTAKKIANNRASKSRCFSRSQRLQTNPNQINPKQHLVTLPNNEEKRTKLVMSRLKNISNLYVFLKKGTNSYHQKVTFKKL